MKTHFTIKQILLSNQNWWNFYQKHQHKLRISIIICVVKLLSCRSIERGYREYHCSNPICLHVKRCFFSCKGRGCSSCGKKASELWIHKQNQKLPTCPWQHITFTMPHSLWDFFWSNRELLNHIGKIAAKCIQTIANAKKVMPGIFIAIHTFGRDLKRNVHIHLSTTTGGFSKEGIWKNLFFDQATLMRIWRYQIITLLRNAQNKLIIPPSAKKYLRHSTFNKFLNYLYKKGWVVFCAKPTANHKQNVEYLARYIKRPPIAESRLRHYDGQSIRFCYLDHRSNTYKNLTLTAEQFIARFVQHIPDRGFRMIRYYGFLANRVIGKLLPLAHKLFGCQFDSTATPDFASLIKKNFNFDPLSCVLCGQQMLLAIIKIGITRISKLLSMHLKLALFATP